MTNSKRDWRAAQSAYGSWQVEDGASGSFPMQLKPTEADARLMAAAPKLANACLSAYDVLRSSSSDTAKIDAASFILASVFDEAGGNHDKQ